MILATLYSGKDFEAWTNTNSTDSDNYLEFTVDRIHSYNALNYKTDAQIKWDGPTMTLFPAEYFFKGNVIVMKRPVIIEDIDTSYAKVEFTTGGLLVNLRVDSWRFVFRSISFVVDGKIHNFYYNDLIIQNYINMKNFKITEDAQVAFYRNHDDSPMYITLRFNFKKTFNSFALLWFHHLCDSFTMNIDIDDSTLPVPMPDGTVDVISKGDVQHTSKLFYDDEAYFPDTEFELLDLLSGYTDKSKWKALILRMNRGKKTLDDTSVVSIDVEMIPAGRLFSEIRTNQNPDFISLGTLMYHPYKNFTLHHITHPWLPGFTQHAVYNKKAVQFIQNSVNDNLVEIETPDLEEKPIIPGELEESGDSNLSEVEGSRDSGLVNPNVDKAPIYSKDFSFLQNLFRNKYFKSHIELEKSIKNYYSIDEILELRIDNQSETGRGPIYRLNNPVTGSVDYYRLLLDEFTDIPTNKESTLFFEYLGSDSELVSPIINPLILNYTLPEVEDIIGSYFNLRYIHTQNEELDETELYALYVFEETDDDGITDRHYYIKLIQEASDRHPINKQSNYEWRYITSATDIINMSLSTVRRSINQYYKQSTFPVYPEIPVLYGVYEQYMGDRKYRYWELFRADHKYPYFPNNQLESNTYWQFKGEFEANLETNTLHDDISVKFEILYSPNSSDETAEDVNNDLQEEFISSDFATLTTEELANIGEVVHSLRFPKEILLSAYDYTHVTYNTAITFKEHFIDYAIFSQYDFLRGIYNPIHKGMISPGKYIKFNFDAVKYPIILYNLIDSYWRDKLSTNMRFSNKALIQIQTTFEQEFEFKYFKPVYEYMSFSFTNYMNVDVKILTNKEILESRFNEIRNSLKPTWRIIYNSFDFEGLTLQNMTIFYNRYLPYLIMPTLNENNVYHSRNITYLKLFSNFKINEISDPDDPDDDNGNDNNSGEENDD